MELEKGNGRKPSSASCQKKRQGGKHEFKRQGPREGKMQVKDIIKKTKMEKA